MKLIKILTILLLVTFAASIVIAADGGNSRKGKYLFKKSCKPCHISGAEGGELTPLKKTQKQWDRFFTEDKHKQKPEALDTFSEQDLKDINQFLFDHAVDSDQPETCG
jgi:mono/diheme cytochrome c family protein